MNCWGRCFLRDRWQSAFNPTRLEFSTVVGYLLHSNKVGAEAEETPLLEAVPRERLVKTQQTEMLSRVRVRVTLRLTVGQSVSLSWCRASSGAHDQILLLFDSYCLVLGRAPSLTRGRVCRLSESVRSITSVVIMYSYIHFT
jgi:hypothetical protein